MKRVGVAARVALQSTTADGRGGFLTTAAENLPSLLCDPRVSMGRRQICKWDRQSRLAPSPPCTIPLVAILRRR